MDAIPGPDGGPRCPWSLSAPGFLEYHDAEWGFPAGDDVQLFEKVCLEAFQSGLSWRTILDKRENFRSAFLGFDFTKVAKMGQEDVERLMQDAGIVRNRAKIEAVINNAQRMVELLETQSLASLVWQFESNRTSPPSEPIATTEESVALAKDLKRRGWKFVGPTTAYAFMQAMGLVNDHVEGCVIRERVEAARESFSPPA